MKIIIDDLTGTKIEALLELHLADFRKNTPGVSMRSILKHCKNQKSLFGALGKMMSYSVVAR